MVQPHLWACGRRKWQTSLCHSVPIPISSISMSPDATASSQKSQPEALKSWRDLSVGNTQQTALCPWSSGTFCLVTLHHHQKYECHFKNLQNMIHFPFSKPPMVETCWNYWQQKNLVTKLPAGLKRSSCGVSPTASVALRWRRAVPALGSPCQRLAFPRSPDQRWSASVESNANLNCLLVRFHHLETYESQLGRMTPHKWKKQMFETSKQKTLMIEIPILAFKTRPAPYGSPYLLPCRKRSAARTFYLMWNKLVSQALLQQIRCESAKSDTSPKRPKSLAIRECQIWWAPTSMLGFCLRDLPLWGRVRLYASSINGDKLKLINSCTGRMDSSS